MKSPTLLAAQSDVQLLRRLKELSWLSAAQIKRLDDVMAARNVEHKGVIFEERGVLDLKTHILLTGTAELCHLYGSRSRVVAILSPGIMFRMPLMARGIEHNFKWTALNDCRVAELTTDKYIKITLGILRATYIRVANAESGRWSGLMGRYPGFLGFDLQARVAIALLELAFEFGVQNTRGILIRITLTQRQLANLVGASRPRVGEILLDLERRKVVVREGRQLAVLTRNLEALIRKASQNSD
jgi:CRP-like cAMP-binding protein